MDRDRVQFSLAVDAELYRRITNFRFDRRYPTRTGAVVDLLRAGLEAKDREPAREGQREGQ